MNLSQLRLNTNAIITRIDLDKKTEQRLLSMGVREGITVKIIRKSLFGDPIEIKLRTFCLAIRLETAKGITVEQI